MMMEVIVHPRVRAYINSSGERDKIIKHLRKLSEDPFNKRSGMDIRKSRGKHHNMYRLRIGKHRFEYFVEEGKVWVDEGFIRGRGYR